MPGVYLLCQTTMPAPYTIEETSHASGLSVKFIRRMKDALPQLFEKHTERGPANALLFDEGMVEILKQTRNLRNRGRTLRQIRDELSALARGVTEKQANVGQTGETPGTATAQVEEQSDSLVRGRTDFASLLERENTLLRSQVNLLQGLLQRAEERFDRLLPAGKPPGMIPEQPGLKSQLLLWLVEAVVVTAFASGFIFLIWFFAQKAFRL